MADVFAQYAPAAPAVKPAAAAPGTPAPASGDVFAQYAGAIKPGTAPLPVAKVPVKAPVPAKSLLQKVEALPGEALDAVEGMFGAKKPAPVTPKANAGGDVFAPYAAAAQKKPATTGDVFAKHVNPVTAPNFETIDGKDVHKDMPAGLLPPAPISSTAAADTFKSITPAFNESTGMDTTPQTGQENQNATKLNPVDVAADIGGSMLGGFVPFGESVAQSIRTGSLAPVYNFEKQNLADAQVKIDPLTGQPPNEDYVKPHFTISRALNGLVAGFAGHGDVPELEPVISRIVKSSDPVDIGQALRSIGVQDDLVKVFADQLAKTDSPREVKRALDTIANLQATTKPNISNPEEGVVQGNISRAAEPAAEDVESLATKAQAAATPEEFTSSLTPKEVETVIKTAGTDEHLDYSAPAPDPATLEPLADTPGVFKTAGEEPDYYYDSGEGKPIKIDTAGAAADYMEHTAGEEPGGLGDIYDHSEPPQDRASLQQHITDLTNYLDVHSEFVQNDAAKGLLKYYGRNDPRMSNLDDIFSRNSGNGKAGTLDVKAQEAGFDNVQDAHDAVLSYLDSRDALADAKNELRDAKRSLKAMGPEPSAAKASNEGTPARAGRRPKFRRPASSYADVGSFNKIADKMAPSPLVDGKSANGEFASVGDLLRRRAYRADLRRPVDARGLVEGDASTEAQGRAVLDSMDGGIGKGPFKGWSDDLKNWFQTWVFGRQSVPVETKFFMKDFAALKSIKGKEADAWIEQYLGKEMAPNAPVIIGKGLDRSGMFGKVADALDTFLKDERRVGVPVKYKENYLPIYLDNYAGAESDRLPPGETELSGRMLGLHPSFTMDSVFEDYIEAAKAGYKRKYDSPYEILQTRAAAHFKAIADAKMFNEGVRSGWIIPKTAVDPKYKSAFRDLDSERFPSRRSSYGNTVYNGVYTSPGAVAEKINTYLKAPNRFLKAWADAAGAAKNSVLSVGIPGTAINPHFFNILPREVLSELSLSPARAPLEIGRFLTYTLVPKLARNYIEAHLEEAMPLLRNGMSFSTEDMSLRELDAGTGILGRAGKGAQAIGKMLHNTFGGNMFGGLLPATKMNMGLRLQAAYEKSGMASDDAARQAADDVNTVFGGINVESLGRSKDWQNFLRATILAPDYAETNVRLGSRLASGVFKPGSKNFNLYGRFAYWLVGAYAVANIVNYMNTGKWMYQNDPTHSFDIATGQDAKGKTRYFKVFGTGIDFARLPAQFITALVEGNGNEAVASIRDRLSTLLGPALSLVSNTDYRGDPIFGNDRYGKPQSGAQQAINFFDNTIGSELPGSISSLTDYAAGRTSTEQLATQSAGLPLSYKSEAPTTADINALKTQAATDIKAGNYVLFNKLVKAGAISQTSRGAFIRNALRGKTAKQIASAAKTKAKLAQTKVNLQAAGFGN